MKLSAGLNGIVITFSRLPDPYSDCMRNVDEMFKNEMYGKYLDTQMEYSEDNCWEICAQVQVIPCSFHAEYEDNHH